MSDIQENKTQIRTYVDAANAFKNKEALRINRANVAFQVIKGYYLTLQPREKREFRDQWTGTATTQEQDMKDLAYLYEGILKNYEFCAVARETTKEQIDWDTALVILRSKIKNQLL